MAEHKWEWGDWGQTRGGTVVRFVSHWNGDIFLCANGSINCLGDVEYLPDCTGYDWKPIEPPDGYRLLKPEEKVRNCDMARLKRDGTWLELRKTAEADQIADYTYARKIEPQYRPFLNADEFEPHCERWLRSKVKASARYRVVEYDDSRIWVFGQLGLSYAESFEICEFKNGEPFGVEIK